MYRIFKLAGSVVLALRFALAAEVYELEAKKLANLMSWKPGDAIAEIGAGEGQMSFWAVVLVGNAGHIYMTELDDKKISHLKEKVKREKLQNVTVIKADRVRTNLPDACCEAIFMRRVYHHFVDPGRTGAALFRDLKPGGLIGIIDFPPRSGLVPVTGVPKKHGGHGIPRHVLTQELKDAGFEIVSESNDWPEQDYCVIARKPAKVVRVVSDGTAYSLHAPAGVASATMDGYSHTAIWRPARLTDIGISAGLEPITSYLCPKCSVTTAGAAPYLE